MLKSDLMTESSYERYMGDWSQRVGKPFLDWLAAPSGLKWIDVGCGETWCLHRTAC